MAARVSRPLKSDRVSFELSQEAVEALRVKLVSTPGLGAFGQQQHLQPARSPLAPSLQDPNDPEFKRWKAQYPCLLERFDAFAEEAEGKRVVVFLDYDGTLTPIVKNPDRAFMSDQMRETVRVMALLFPTAIVSGRGREKVEAFVQLRELFYAGSHGMDIVGPQPDRGSSDKRRQSCEELAFQPAARFEPIMHKVCQQLEERIRLIPGASVENNKFCVSVHFRNCEESAWEDVQAAVQATLAEQPELRLSRGRKVLELRPEVEWDKGHALAHLLNALGLEGCDDVLPIYIGDDRTDEDAFRLLSARKQGLGILVSTRAKPTDAKYTLQDPSEVLSFLQRLVAWGRGPANGWHSARGCRGWKLDASAAEPAADSAHLDDAWTSAWGDANDVAAYAPHGDPPAHASPASRTALPTVREGNELLDKGSSERRQPSCQQHLQRQAGTAGGVCNGFAGFASASDAAAAAAAKFAGA